MRRLAATYVPKPRETRRPEGAILPIVSCERSRFESKTCSVDTLGVGLAFAAARRLTSQSVFNASEPEDCSQLTSRVCRQLPEFALRHEFITEPNPFRNFGLRWRIRSLERALARTIAARRRWHSRVAAALLKHVSPVLATCSRCVRYPLLSDL